MDLFDTLLGGRGCSTDGSLTQNPITSMVDSVFNSHVGVGQHEQLPSIEGDQGYFMEQPSFQTGQTAGWQENYSTSEAGLGFHTYSTGASAASTDMGNQMFGGPQMWQQQQQYMMMQQHAAMSQMMQMQNQQAMMNSSHGPDQNYYAEKNSDYNQYDQSENYEENREDSNYRQELNQNYSRGNEGEYYEQNTGGGRERQYVPERFQEIGTSSTDGLTRALEEALNEGELNSHKLDEIWSSFGAELTENDPNYAGTDAVDWTAERDRQQKEYGIQRTYTSEISNDGQSLEGYKKAWEDLSAKLEAGKDDYIFATTNPYVRTESEHDGEIVDLFAQGMTLFKEGKIREAVLAFEGELQKDRSSSEAWRMLGVCHAENDEDKKAIICLKRSVEEDPYSTDSLLALGTSYVNELDSVRALECLRSWVAHNPLFQGLKVEADEYSDGSQIDEVMQLMLAVAAHSPSNGEVQVVLGILYNISQDFDNAIDCFRKAVDFSPPDYSLLNKLGATLANNNKSEEAVRIYAKALSDRPTYARGWLNLGISFANMNQYEEAAKAYIQALHLTPSARHIWGYLRVVFTSMNRLDLSEMSSQENAEMLGKELNIQLIHPS